MRKSGLGLVAFGPGGPQLAESGPLVVTARVPAPRLQVVAERGLGQKPPERRVALLWNYLHPLKPNGARSGHSIPSRPCVRLARAACFVRSLAARSSLDLCPTYFRTGPLGKYAWHSMVRSQSPG